LQAAPGARALPPSPADGRRPPQEVGRARRGTSPALRSRPAEHSPRPTVSSPAMRGPVLRLKKGRDRARVHPWVFKGDVADVAEGEPGAAVRVVDSAGGFVGRGFFNPRPALCCRIVTRQDEALDGGLWRRRLEAALGRRVSALADTTAARLVWSE